LCDRHGRAAFRSRVCRGGLFSRRAGLSRVGQSRPTVLAPSRGGDTAWGCEEGEGAVGLVMARHLPRLSGRDGRCRLACAHGTGSPTTVTRGERRSGGGRGQRADLGLEEGIVGRARCLGPVVPTYTGISFFGWGRFRFRA